MFVNATSSDIDGLYITLPFVPSKSTQTISNVGVNQFPENSYDYLLESDINLDEPIIIKANSVVTITSIK